MGWSIIIAIVFGALILGGCETAPKTTGFEVTAQRSDPVAEECAKHNVPTEKDIPKPAPRAHDSDDTAIAYAQLRGWTKGTVRKYGQCAVWARGQRPRTK